MLSETPAITIFLDRIFHRNSTACKEDPPQFRPLLSFFLLSPILSPCIVRSLLFHFYQPTLCFILAEKAQSRQFYVLFVCKIFQDFRICRIYYNETKRFKNATARSD